MRTFETIIGLMHPQPSPSVTLVQHQSAMRMDKSYAASANAMIWAITDARKAVGA